MESDYQIQEDVMKELKWKPFLKAQAGVKAEIDGSRVTLKDTVRSIAQKEDAENAA